MVLLIQFHYSKLILCSLYHKIQHSEGMTSSYILPLAILDCHLLLLIGMIDWYY